MLIKYDAKYTHFYLKFFVILQLWILDCCPCIFPFPQYEMTTKQIHVHVNHISFCFIPKIWRLILGIVAIISTASQWWRQYERLRQKSGGTHRQILLHVLHMNYLRFGNKSEVRYKRSKDRKFQCLSPRPWAFLVNQGGARDLAQQRKLIETSEFQSKG